VTKVLFVCIGNSGRSLMAERLFRREAEDRHEARSAGRAPGSQPEPTVVEALRELGIEAGDHVPSRLDDEKIEWADVVVAVCDDACPVIPSKPYVSWQFPDPWGLPLEDVRVIRDDIAASVGALVSKLDNSPAQGG
jgi:arsenate reductase